MSQAGPSVSERVHVAVQTTLAVDARLLPFPSQLRDSRPTRKLDDFNRLRHMFTAFLSSFAEGVKVIGGILVSIITP